MVIVFGSDHHLQGDCECVGIRCLCLYQIGPGSSTLFGWHAKNTLNGPSGSLLICLLVLRVGPSVEFGNVRSAPKTRNWGHE